MKVCCGLEGSFNTGKALSILELPSYRGKEQSVTVQRAQQRAGNTEHCAAERLGSGGDGWQQHPRKQARCPVGFSSA